MPDAPPPNVALMQMIFGKWVAQAISVAARFKIADQLASGPKTAAAVAAATGTQPALLYRIMRALGNVGVLAESADGTFALTPLGEFLRSDVPGSLRAIATYCGDPWSWKPWGEVAERVRSGEDPFFRVFKQSPWEYLAQHPEESATFNDGMTGFSQGEAAAAVKAYDFSKFGTVVDVGGGHGWLLCSILNAAPNSKGVVFDLPEVVVGAPAVITAAKLESRCRTEAGSFFETVPAGGDAYVFKHIIHDWNDAKSTEILKTCRKAMKPGSKLLLIEMVIPPAGERHFGKLLDLEMLVICDGKERTESEYRALLAGAGYKLSRIVPTEAPVSVIEADPV